MRVGDGHAVRPAFERRIDARFGDDAVGDREADFIGLVAGGNGGHEGGRDRLPGVQRAVRGAAALAAGEGADQAGGGAVRCRFVMRVGDVDHPVAFTDRNAGQCRRITGLQLALRAQAGRRDGDEPGGEYQSETQRAAQGQHDGLSSSRSHLGYGADDLTGGCARHARGALGGPRKGRIYRVSGRLKSAWIKSNVGSPATHAKG